MAWQLDALIHTRDIASILEHLAEIERHSCT